MPGALVTSHQYSVGEHDGPRGTGQCLLDHRCTLSQVNESQKFFPSKKWKHLKYVTSFYLHTKQKVLYVGDLGFSVVARCQGTVFLLR